MFYDKFLELCNKKGVKPTPAATAAGISKSLVSKWRSEEIEIPSAEVLNKLSKYFNIPVSELLGEEPEKENSPSKPVFTEGEYRLVEAYRAKPPAERKALLTLLGLSEDC